MINPFIMALLWLTNSPESQIKEEAGCPEAPKPGLKSEPIIWEKRNSYWMTAFVCHCGKHQENWDLFSPCSDCGCVDGFKRKIGCWEWEERPLSESENILSCYCSIYIRPWEYLWCRDAHWIIKPEGCQAPKEKP